MSEKPILFKPEMVRAILDGKKTMTRRVMKLQPEIDERGMWHWKDCQWMDGGMGFPHSGIEEHAPYKPGDILWVRETWNRVYDQWSYKADLDESMESALNSMFGGQLKIQWCPSIHMPRASARIFLRVTDVRVERLQELTPADVAKEGVYEDCWECLDKYGEGGSQCCYKIDDECMHADSCVAEFEQLWNSINAKRDGGRYAWERNPFCWVYTFERVDVEAHHE